MPHHKPSNAVRGLPMFFILVIGVIFLARLVTQFSIAEAPGIHLLSAFGFIAAIVSFRGFFTLQPNEAKALTLFGRYKGTVSQDGVWWANPFLQKRSISLRVRNFETAKLKVNDSDSSPIEIGAIVVWKVVDAAEALFEVENYVRYVEVQAESALRTVATQYPYDSRAAGELSLSTHTEEVSTALEEALADRLREAGVEVIEARISHLAYAPEIAAAMLQRQQASAIIAARQKIVEGAVGMVEMALAMLNDKGIVSLDLQ